MNILQNKVALITGGSLGIGLATAKELLENGAKVIVVGRDENKIISAYALLGDDVLFIKADLSKVAEIKKMYQKISECYEKIDILFANAGVGIANSVGNVSEIEFDQMVDTNFKGSYFLVQHALPFLQSGSSVILNASISALVGMPRSSVYAATKAALLSLAKTFAADLAEKTIRVNSIAPGNIDTAFWDYLKNSPIFNKVKSMVPLGQRFGTPEEVAKLVLFLASDDASYITGQNFTIDGGLSTIFTSNYQQI
jgi:NAD(P)-dependent dehydrogenase (short-subunit alcohol dehydrogenase family)